MLRHKNKAHRDQEEDAWESNSTEPESMDDDGSNTESEEDSDSWDTIINLTFQKLQPQFGNEVKSLQETDHVDEEEARNTVYEAMRSTYRKAVMENFMARMQWWCDIQQDPIFKAIKRTASHLMDIEDYDRSEAWKYATSKRKYLFDKLLSEYNPPHINSTDV